MTTIIMLNGEKEVGKSRFAKELRDQLNAGWHPATAGRFSLIAPVHEAVISLYEWCTNSSHTEWEDEYLSKVKGEFFAGYTGREWMIMLGNAFRQHDVDSFIRISLQHLHTMPDPLEFVIFDNWGFKSELNAMRRLVPIDWRIETIHLNARAKESVAANEQYSGDNRFNLMHLCDWLNPSVRIMADYLQPTIDHHTLRDSFVFPSKEQRLKAGVDAVVHKPTREGLQHVSEMFDTDIDDNNPHTSASRKA